jgi:hypothetical protein
MQRDGLEENYFKAVFLIRIVLGPPGSGSVIILYGSGSSHHQKCQGSGTLLLGTVHKIQSGFFGATSRDHQHHPISKMMNIKNVQ